MRRIKKIIQEKEDRFDVFAERFLQRHPYLGYMAVFMGIPVIILAAVFISTVFIMLPVSCFMRWI